MTLSLSVICFLSVRSDEADHLPALRSQLSRIRRLGASVVIRAAELVQVPQRCPVQMQGVSRQKLRNLRKRLANIRVFDPACGSGNFLVIAYKEMRAIEAVIVERLGGEANLKLDERRSVIPLSNFHGIEIKGFAAEIARLALLIAEFQADCLYLSQQEARAMVLPLHKTGQITVGNALRVNWLEVCPPACVATGTDLDPGGLSERQTLVPNGLESSAEQETYICGNPPYVGSKWQTEAQRADIAAIFSPRSKNFRTLDYVAGWFLKAADRVAASTGAAAFVSTNSIAQGEQVALLWPLIFAQDVHIRFAHQSFKWQNLAAHNAGVTVVIVGIAPRMLAGQSMLFEGDSARVVTGISPYLFAGDEVIVEKRSKPVEGLAGMQFGNHPYYATDLMLSPTDATALVREQPAVAQFLRPLYGSQEFVNGAPRVCVWVSDNMAADAAALPELRELFERVRAKRLGATADKTAQQLAKTAYRFRDQATAKISTLIIPRVTSERRPYLPVGLLSADAIIQDQAFAAYDAPIWNMALIASQLHKIWVGTVCSRMRTDFRYSNTLGWNTFPVPRLTGQDKADLACTAEKILLAREAHFPATIADLYDPEAMPEDLRRAHDENDEILERIYIGRRFRNDTERLEKLFDLYTKMAANVAPKGATAKRGKKAA